MNSAVLVTGATGFIGRRLVAALKKRGQHVVTHSSRDGDIADCPIGGAGVGHVFHLAARTYVPDSWKDPLAFYKVNVLGTVNVLEYCRRQGASLTLLSSYVYGIPEFLPIPESHPVRPFNPYSHTKIMAEGVSRYFAEAFHIPVTIVRPFNIYGPGQASHFLIPKLLRQAVSVDYPDFLVDDIRPKRDYLFIDDLIALLVTLMDRRITSTFNAGSGYSIGIAEIVKSINSLLQTNKKLISRENIRTSEVLDVFADISKARNETGWHPTVPLEVGLARSLECVVA